MESVELKEIIFKSKERCRRYGLKEEGGAFFKYPQNAVNKALRDREELINITIPFMETIYYAVNRLRFVVVLTNEDGIVLSVVAAPNVRPALENINFDVGVSCAEKDVGTNGIGTALAVGKPVEVYGSDHYCIRYRHLATVGVPIHDPTKGFIIGCLGCCGVKDVFHPHTLGMLIAASTAIERQIRLEITTNELILRSKLLKNTISSVSEGLVSFDAQGYIQEINDVAKELLGVGDTRTNASHLFSEEWYKRIVVNGEAVQDAEMVIRTKKGKEKVFVTAKPILEDGSGRVTGVVAILRESSRVHRLANRITGAHAWFTFDDIIGEDPAFVEVLEMARTVSRGSCSHSSSWSTWSLIISVLASRLFLFPCQYYRFSRMFRLSSPTYFPLLKEYVVSWKKLPLGKE